MYGGSYEYGTSSRGLLDEHEREEVFAPGCRKKQKPLVMPGMDSYLALSSVSVLHQRKEKKGRLSADLVMNMVSDALLLIMLSTQCLVRTKRLK